MRQALDRSGPIPLYRQLAEIVRGEIEEGTYPVGSLLPSESELGARWDVSRSVVRQTLNSLAHQGVIRTEKGRGSFVAEAKLNQHFVQRTTGFYDDLTQMGYRIETRIVNSGLVPVDGEIAEFLGVSEAVELDRVRAVDGRVLTYVRTYLVPERCPDILDADLRDRSLYDVLHDAYGLSIERGRRTVEAVAADEEVAHHLEISPGDPVLFLRSAGVTRDGRPLEWYDAWHRGDRTRFEVAIASDVAEVQLQQRTVFPANEFADPTPVAGFPGERAPWRSSALAAALARCPIIVSVPAPAPDEVVELVTALREGGVHAVEFAAGDAPESLFDAAAAVSGVLLGAGVPDAEAGRRALDAGASFLASRVVQPVLATDVRHATVLLGGATPTELRESWRFSESPVVWYPSGDPAELRSLVATLPGVGIIPVVPLGRSVADLLAAGAHAVLIDVVDLPDASHFAELTALVRAAAQEAAPFRKDAHA